MRRHLYILLFLLARLGFAQHYPVVEYTNREGLAQMQVTGVLEDSRGYIWAVTKGGLSKFDGERFENFYRHNGLKYQMNLDALTEDSKGNIWLSYLDRGFAKFDGKTFTNYIFESTKLSNIVEYKGAMVFIRNDSLYKILNEKIVFTGVVSEKNISYRIQTDPQTGILYKTNKVDKDEHCVYYLDEKTKKFISIIKEKEVDFQFYKINQQLLVKKYSEQKIEFFQLKNKQITKYFSFTSTQQHFDSYPDYSFVFGYNNQVFLFDKSSKNITKISDDISQEIASINNNFQSSKLFFGTETGLKCVFLNGFKSFTKKEVPYAWGVGEDNEKNIWITNYNHSLQKFSNNTLENITEHHKPIINKFRSFNKPISLSSINSWYYNPLKDKHGKLWLSRLVGAVIIENNKFDFLIPNTKYVSFFNIAEDRKRNKIIGCSQVGITIIENKAPYKYEFVSDTTAAMFQNSRFILTAAVDTLGNYWLGGRHIAKYNPISKTFKYYDDINKKMPKRGVANLIFDSRGGLWAGTFDEGLAKYNAKTDKFEPVFEKYLLNQPTSFLGQISEKYFMIGDRLNLYIIDLDALYKYNKEVVVKVLNYHNGFMGLEPSQNGFFKDSNGKIWICSGTVLSVLDPKLLNLETGTLRTYIREINEQKLPFDYENLSAVELERDNNNVKIVVESVGEDKSANAQFSYRIKGFQENWSAWQEEKAIYLTNLPAGTYTIEVRSKRGKVDADHPTTHLKFSINIPFWKSPDFYIYASLIGLLLIGVLGLIGYRSLKQAIKLKNQENENSEQERKIKLLQIMTTQAQLNPHFIFNVLQTINSDILLNKKPEMIGQNIINLAQLIRSFLTSSIIDSKNNKSVYELEISLEDEIELLTTYIEFEKDVKNNFEYSLTVHPPLNVVNFELQPLLIQPFVENAIKHGFQDLGRKGFLKIDFYEEDEKLIIEIDDDGIGREKSNKIKEKSRYKFKSVGTDLVRTRIESLNEIGYDIHATTTDKAQGTHVKITMDYK